MICKQEYVGSQQISEQYGSM